MKTITKHFINGEFVDSHGTELVEIRDPKNNELIGRAIMGDAVDAERAIAAAKAALPAWSQTTLADRKLWLQRLADALTERLDELKAMCVAEFGGKSPTVILPDADVEGAIRFALMVGLNNSGQACIAGTRILVPENRADEFKAALKAGM